MTQASPHQLQSTIELAWESRASINATNSPEIYTAVESVIADLNAGRLRVAERQGVGQWTVNQWVKKAVLLSFRLNDNKMMRAGDLGFFDKVQTKFAHLTEDEMRATGVRVVPPAVARRGSYVAKNVVLMPSYVNIGAYVDEGTMVDTWATVGSCAQIGKNVHLSGGVGIGGVLEPPQAAPVVIEDDAFIGSRSMVTEGARVGTGAMLGAGVILNPSIPVIDAQSGETVSRGHVPPWCLVINATRPKEFPGGTFGMPCALIIRRFAEGERHDKAALNEILREHGVAT
jgi:2,3,4,5-tetrahydropyridine-2-carboxylate N-succinyltransferase